MDRDLLQQTQEKIAAEEIIATAATTPMTMPTVAPGDSASLAMEGSWDCAEAGELLAIRLTVGARVDEGEIEG